MSARNMRRHANGGIWVAIALISACGTRGKGEPESAPASDSAAPVTRVVADSTGPVSMNINVMIGSSRQQIVASGRCGYEPNASIFDKPAEMWIAQAGETSGPYLNLSLWKLKSGEPMQFNLAVTTGADLHEISTVAGGTTRGTGTATMTTMGRGGVIDIHGTDAGGASVVLSVHCMGFVPIAEEGGR